VPSPPPIDPDTCYALNIGNMTYYGNGRVFGPISKETAEKLHDEKMKRKK
jgi:hypothetical protein